MTNHISLKRFYLFFVGVAASLTVTGCSSNIIPDHAIYKEGKSVVIMWEAPTQNATEYGVEAGGLIGALITEAARNEFHPEAIALKEVMIAPIVTKNYVNDYGQELERKGLNVNLVHLPIDPQKLREKSKKDRKEAPYDFTHLKTERNIDYVLFLDIDKFGVRRTTAYGISVGKPKPDTTFVLYLIDTADNTIMGRYHFEKVDTSHSPNWEENNYAQYKKDIAQNLITGLREAYFGFFEPGKK